RSITNLIYRMINHLQSKYPLKGYNQDKPSQALILGCFLMAVNKLQKSKIPMGAGHPSTVIAHNLRLRRMIEAKQRKHSRCKLIKMWIELQKFAYDKEKQTSSRIQSPLGNLNK